MSKKTIERPAKCGQEECKCDKPDCDCSLDSLQRQLYTQWIENARSDQRHSRRQAKLAIAMMTLSCLAMFSILIINIVRCFTGE